MWEVTERDCCPSPEESQRAETPGIDMVLSGVGNIQFLY